MLVNVALSALFATAALAAPSNRHLTKRQSATGFNWGNEVIRGVNIGGWLVLEPWITPSIFQVFPDSMGIVDEYTLGQNTNYTYANATLVQHWNNWFQYSDIQKISDSGFNLIRIPIGYWAYDNSGTPYVSGAAGYLDEAINWSRQLGLKVLIDLHGAPGSQNGFDNSGQKMPTPQWQSVDPGATKTLAVLQQIQSKYGDSSYDDVIAGIELLNEPLISELNFDDVRTFERNGYNQQRQYSQSRVVVIQDGFEDPSSYNGFLSVSDNNAQNVAIDHHDYQVFTNEFVAMQPWQHRQYVCNNVGTYSGADKWTFVGEWTAAMTDCAAALNGYTIGARYDGTYPGSTYVGSCATINWIDTWSDSLREDTRSFIEAQMEAFEANTQGWIFWNFKTEASAEWDAFRLIDAGIFPQPLTSRNFSAICT
ncbi:hypothetical protein MBLNU457_1469t2 [Dothideomycetes sp. NU457]